MLNGLVFRSGHLEFSGQSGKDRGDEKSARPGRSYASFLAAVRAKTGQSVPGWPPDAQDKDARPFGQVALPVWGRKAARRGKP